MCYLSEKVDFIYVLIPDEFVGLSIGFFKGKKSELTPGGNVTTKGRKRGSCFIVVEFLSPPKRYKKGGFKSFLSPFLSTP